MRALSSFEPLRWPHEGPEAGAALDEPTLGFLHWLDLRFGLDAAAFAEHRLWHRPGHHALWIAQRDCEAPPGLRLEAMGLLMSRRKGARYKVSAVCLQRFGAHITRNLYRLQEPELQRWLAYEAIAVEPLDIDGDVAVADHHGLVLGRGRLIEGTLHCELPRSWLNP